MRHVRATLSSGKPRELPMDDLLLSIADLLNK
jgi:hypothetical protein